MVKMNQVKEYFDPKVKKMNSEDRKKQLLEVALHVFAEDGYHGATTARIAEVAGVTEPTLYRYFPNKRELFLAVLEDSRNFMINALSLIIKRVKDPVDALNVIMDVNRETLRDSDIERHIVWFMALATNDPDVRDVVRRYDEGSLNLLAGEIKRAQESGSIRKDFEPKVLARVMISLTVEWMIMVLLGTDRNNEWIFEREKEFISRTFVKQKEQD